LSFVTVVIDIGWLTAVLMTSIRVAAGLSLAPVLGPTTMPASARVIVVLALSVFVVSALPVTAAPLGLAQLVVGALGEALVGASLAFGFLAAYGAAQWAGHVLDVQMGYSAAVLLNPTTRSASPLLATLFGLLCVAVILAIDGHHVLIRAFDASLQAFPPGRAAMDLDWGVIVAHAGAMFTFGLALAAPVMIALLLADLGMAVIARSMPQLNVFVLSFAIKIMLGLLGLVASAPFAGAVLTQLFDTTFRYWDAVSTGP
jgi:flagellar biosynthetic protein FliR